MRKISLRPDIRINFRSFRPENGNCFTFYALALSSLVSRKREAFRKRSFFFAASHLAGQQRRRDEEASKSYSNLDVGSLPTIAKRLLRMIDGVR